MKRRWKRLWARKYSLFLGNAWTHSFLSYPGLPKVTNKLFVPEGSLYALYFDEHEFQILINAYTRFLMRQNMTQYARRYEKEFSDFLRWATIFGARDFSSMPIRLLQQGLKELTQRLYHFGDIQILSFVVLEGPAATLEHWMIERGQKHLIQAIITPSTTTKTVQARLDLLMMARDQKTDLRSRQRYLNKYTWMPMYDFSDHPWTMKDVVFQLKHIKNAARELSASRFHQQEMQREYRKLVRSLTSPQERKLVEITHLFSYLKEMRDDYRRPAYLALQPFWKEIGRRLRLSVRETQYLLPRELHSSLATGRVNRTIIRQRQESFAFSLDKGRLTVRSGRKETLLTSRHVDVQYAFSGELRGTPASPGIVRGIVRVIHHQGEFSTFHSNDILVTTMTHPEFVPIMRRAMAIITDEGGITCHAAIVAREMKKPCIIGTKKATKVLKDGDLVEVDATKGIVRKIKNA